MDTGAANSGDKGWAEGLADFHVSHNLILKTERKVIKEAFMAGYAARMIDEGAKLDNNGWPYFPPSWSE